MAKTGRPKKSIDWDDFERLCYMQCTLEEMCQWFHVSHQTLERRCKAHYGQTFGQVFSKKRVGGLISLRRNLFQLSEKNAAVAIFLAKNWLGMNEKHEMEHTGDAISPDVARALESTANLMAELRKLDREKG